MLVLIVGSWVLWFCCKLVWGCGFVVWIRVWVLGVGVGLVVGFWCSGFLVNCVRGCRNRFLWAVVLVVVWLLMLGFVAWLVLGAGGLGVVISGGFVVFACLAGWFGCGISLRISACFGCGGIVVVLVWLRVVCVVCLVCVCLWWFVSCGF